MQRIIGEDSHTTMSAHLISYHKNMVGFVYLQQKHRDLVHYYKYMAGVVVMRYRNKFLVVRGSAA